MTEDNTERTLDDVLAELNPLQLAFVKARAVMRFDKHAADEAGCHEKTPIRWRKLGIPIDEAVKLLRIGAIQDARDQMSAAATEAVEVILKVMRKGNNSQKLRAAEMVLDRVGLPATTHIDGTLETAGLMIVMDDGPRTN